MGRIKSLMVKRAAKQLLSEENTAFTSSFERNKKLLGNMMPSMPIRNKVAGYIARLIKMKSKVRKPKAVKEVPDEKERYY
ncbi:30S ribosomal protein S17e [Candidatus Pacearchaeota archaeon]|nr:30S ribosomal protein S17e [Candidatus Pacearchaeota archaeon]